MPEETYHSEGDNLDARVRAGIMETSLCHSSIHIAQVIAKKIANKFQTKKQVRIILNPYDC